MLYRKPPVDAGPLAASLSFSRIAITEVAAWLVLALFSLGPVSFLIVDDVGGVVWALCVLAGFVVACACYRQWWLDLKENGRPVLVCLGIALLYLALPVLSYCLIDSSEFALSRVTRQFLLLGTPLVLLLLWRLRLGLRTVLAIIAANAVFLGVYACWYAQSLSGRVEGIVHAVHFGNISLFLGFASLALLPVASHYGWRLLAAAGMILGGTAAMLAGARGGWLAVPILLTVALIMVVRVFRLRRGMIFGLVALTALLLAGLWHTECVQKNVERLHRELAQLSQDKWLNSMGIRLMMWEQSWLEIREAPLTGTGFSGYRDRIQTAVASGALPERMLDFASEPHNEYFYQWMTRGFPGLALYLLCLAGAAFSFSRLLLRGDSSQIAIAQVGLCLTAVIAIAGLTITVIDQRAVIRFLGWILALLLYCVWLDVKARRAPQTPQAAEARMTAGISQKQDRP